MPVTALLHQLESGDPKIKYGAAKQLLRIAEEDPAALYPHYERWRALADDENNILKWTGIRILGHLAAVDSKGRTERLVPKLIGLLHGGKLITTNNTIFALGLIAEHKPLLRPLILRELLKVPEDAFDTKECRAIATGKVLETLPAFLPELQDNEAVFRFAQQAQTSQRNATRKKAAALLKKMDRAGYYQQGIIL
jgi:hypothetical protein